MKALEQELSASRHHNDREIWSIRMLLLALALGEAVSVIVPRISTHSWGEVRFMPQFGFAIVALVLYIDVASQRSLLRQLSTALTAATSYIDRLEQVSLIDSNTQLFNRKYIDQLFNQQLKSLNRRGKSATLVLFEVLPYARKTSAEEVFIEAALVLRSSFRGSDYVLRNSPTQFLVLLPDTTEEQAQYALNRLTEKVDSWNLDNEMSEMGLRHELSTCLPGGDLWETLRDIEDRLRNKPEPQSDRAFPERCNLEIVQPFARTAESRVSG